MPNHDPQRLAHWRTLIAEHVQSGLSITTFCRQRQISKSGFHRWKTVTTTLDSGGPLQPMPPSKRRDTPASPVFVPVRVVPEVLVEVVLPNGVQLRLPLSADVAHVARLVKAVATC